MRVAVVPATPLLVDPASSTDPIPEIREAARSAARWLSPPVRVWGPRAVAQALRGEALLAEAPVEDSEVGDLLVVADGSAKRFEKAPGHFDERSLAFDASIEAALATGDVAALGRLDPVLAEELWCRGAAELRRLGSLPAPVSATLDLAAAPFGVAYWVARWKLPD